MTRVRASIVLLGVMAWSASAFAGDDQPPKKEAKPAAQPPGPAQAARDDIKAMFGFVPGFLNDMPDSALPGAWDEMKNMQMSPKTALPGKIKELIGLAVSAQVPCKYCVYAHTEFAELNGATKQEVGEALVMASLARHWSTVLQGQQTDLAKFKAEIRGWLDHVRKLASGKAPAPRPIQVVDAQTAMQDIQQTFGSVPDFIRKFPPEALPGAWREMRDVEMNPGTALSGKYKSLIGLAVAAQVPCRFCLAADTEFARMEGATEREISEAIAMSAITRHWSTYLNGAQTDEAAFKRDVDKLVRAAKKQAAKAAQPVAAAPKPAAPVASAASPAAAVQATAPAQPKPPAAKPAPAPTAAAKP
jgi:AhpD family alkylhydroperoxidase